MSMIHSYSRIISVVCFLACLLSSCLLDKEPNLPTGVTNLVEPIFDNVSVSADTNLFFKVTAKLTTLGNLNIQEHGWVWSETPNPTLQNNYRNLGSLTIDSFATEISDLELGKPYYLRPFVSTGSELIYGPEQCSFLGVNFTINTDTEIFKGAIVHFSNTSVGNNNTYSWFFGDGITSTESSPVHTFDTLGRITVNLTATQNGCSSNRKLVLKVIPNPFENYWMAIPGGTFIMGCTPEQGSDCKPEESPAHPITLSTFTIGKTEITQFQWQSVIGYNQSNFYQCGPDCPVETVSWNRIVEEFIPALNRKTGIIHRLPTEAEWEYAARGGLLFFDMTKYAGSNDLNLAGWYNENSGSSPHPVMQKSPNAYNLYDMSGNVYEWCLDRYSSNYYSISPDTNPTGPSNGGNRIIRGGSWFYGSINCRITARAFGFPNYGYGDIGFRLVRG